MQFEALNTNTDLSTIDLGARVYRIEQEGDFNLRIDNVGEIKVNDIKGHAGCMISFTVLDGPCAGVNFRQWFCVMVDQQSKLEWMKRQFDAFAIRVGKLNGLNAIQRPEDLTGCVFNAHVLAKPSTYQTTDEFGSIVTKDTIDNSIVLNDPLNRIRACGAPIAPAKPQPLQLKPQYQQQVQSQYQRAVSNPQAINQYFNGQQDNGNLPF